MSFLINPYRFGGAWTPANITTALWLDASDASTITTVSGAVSQWNDKSGNGRNISQATSTQRPALTSAGLNGLNVVTFDGSNDIIGNASVGSSGLTSASVIAVFRMITGGTTEDLPICLGQAGTLGAIRSFYRTQSGTTVGFAGWGADIASSSVSYDIGGSFHVFGFWNTQLAAPNNVRLMRDGTVSTHTTSSNLATTNNGFSLGSSLGAAEAGYYANFAVAEVVVTYDAISDSTRERIEGYLAHKWGLAGSLPAGHPYKSAAPTI